ncbi:MAG: hypothetical protein ACI39G_04680 [Pseudoramibacter sp.]
MKDYMNIKIDELDMTLEEEEFIEKIDYLRRGYMLALDAIACTKPKFTFEIEEDPTYEDEFFAVVKWGEKELFKNYKEFPFRSHFQKETIYFENLKSFLFDSIAFKAIWNA